MARKIVIEPVTRVEGHGKVTILLDEHGKVSRTRLHVVEFRGFERFVQGRLFWELPELTQRLCGICPVSHHLASAKATDSFVGAERLTPTAEKVRRLMHYGQIVQSHAVHFFHLASPDLLFGFGAQADLRNIVGIANAFPEVARQAIDLRAFGQEVIRSVNGKRVHGTGAVPGGVNRNLSLAEREPLIRSMDSQLARARAAVKLAHDYTLAHISELRSFGAVDSNHLSLVAADGALELYDGRLRAIDPSGGMIFDQADCRGYAQLIAEEVRDWSYMKFPFIQSLGPERGWYRVGPLARMNTAHHIDTPEAESARRELRAISDGKPTQMTMAYHWARTIEMLHAVEKIQQLLDDRDLQGTDLVAKGERKQEAVGVIEAPRGTLFHHYRINDKDQVVMANLVVSTTNNNEAMNRSVAKVAQDYLSGVEITEGLLNHIEVAIRAYDPCLSCATHAAGQMALEVVVVDCHGQTVGRRVRT